MRRFADLPIRRKLMAMVLLASGGALLLANAGLFVADLLRFRSDLERDLVSLAEVIADNSTAAITFDDPRAAAETLAALREKPAVVAACIFRAAGGRFAEYRRAGAAPRPLPRAAPPDGARFAAGTLQLVRPIRLHGERIGAVYLEADLADMYARLRLQAATVTIVLLGAAALALLLGAQLLRLVSDPILDLAATAAEVSRRQDFSLRAERRSGDELGQLVDAFNQMLAQLGDRDRQLHEAQNVLEQRVAERTAQLSQELAERRRAEREVAERTAQLSQELAERLRAERELAERNALLDASNRELDDFAYVASHDLKEPLRGIHSFAAFLLEDYGGKLDASGQSKLETLMRLSRRMGALLDSLLHFSRVGRLDLAIARVDLGAVVATVVDTLTVQLAESGVEVRIPRPLPAVRCDQVRIGEVFQNLVANAIKYNDKPDGRWVEIGFSDGAGPLIFYVRDNGMGIQSKHFDAIFRIFKRLHGREHYGGGSGAGLTIVKKIVERHQGRIWLESVPGQGTTFYFTLDHEREAST